ncbi:AAA family ATPase, partial [Jatrophihabitans endophyticus]|uniref:AAA family ATPase n=1 Tax=Jatrophihabitans endophyticus TaxID=1206085 RepID=UPI0019F22904
MERDVELGALRAALERAVAGDGSIVAIRGNAGVGKTSLLRAVTDTARTLGVRSVSAAGGRLELDYPFGVARQLLERELMTAAPAARKNLLAGPARLGAQALAEHGGAGAITADPSSGFVHGLYWLVANLAAEGPLLLTVDDAQWCDDPSLRFLAYLARRLADLPVLLVVATRPDGHPGDEQSFATLTRDLPRTVLLPSPLTGDGVRAMLESGRSRVTGDVAARLQKETGGNPFLVGELARSLAGGTEWTARSPGPVPVPETVARAIQHRIGAAGPSAERLAAAVAALGDGCTVAEAAAVAELERDDAAAAATDLAHADVLALDPAVSFAPPLVRTAVEDGLSGLDRATWHAQAARVLRDRGADDER